MKQTFGRYQVKRQLGQGGQASVYLAYDPKFQRDVALKVLPAHIKEEESLHVRFEREARTIAALQHPAIVPVFDYGEEDGQPYLVMRHMLGGTLHERIKSGPLSFEAAREIALKIASALETAHRNSVIHRDIKPGNILFDELDNPYLADFGIARLIEQATLTKGLIGTPQYMSPEQGQRDSHIDHRADQYAMGILLYEMLTGAPPFPFGDPLAIVNAHLNESIPPISSKISAAPVGLDQFLKKTFAKDREQRFANIEAWSAALKAIPQNSHTPHLPTTSSPRLPAPIPTLSILFGIVLLAALIIGGSVLLSPQSGASPPPTLALQVTEEPTSTIVSLTPSAPLSVNGHEWIEIPAGPFTLGGNDTSLSPAEELPSHQVELDRFWISRFETTNAQYKLFLDEGNIDHLPAIDESCSTWNADGTYLPGLDNHPVVCISWYDALAYTEWLGDEYGLLITLPSEAEWEKAARGDQDLRAFAWGDQFEAGLTNFCDSSCSNAWADGSANDSYAETAPVGAFPAGSSPFGVEDLSGNVWEWTRSLWEGGNSEIFQYPYEPADGREDLSAPETQQRVLRGGSWSAEASLLQVSTRGRLLPDARYPDSGFRIIMR